ncbi:MAG: YqgE/AlgH family protein [Alphaproteobacteria bacterium]|nr:YqgE/AlgH family protein [Alphaproteobacteria bacterium]
MAKRAIISETALKGQVLIAMPGMPDDRFARTVIYMCAYGPAGAMGLVVNRLIDRISFPALLKQLEIDVVAPSQEIRVHFGGPVEGGRGFVLHSADYSADSTLRIDARIGLTASIGALKDIAIGTGPQQCFLALGYAGWAPGQLDAEMQANAWLNAPADPDLLFDSNLETKWQRAVNQLGIDVSLLSSQSGRA